MAQKSNNLTLKRVRENGNVFLALFGAVAIVGVIGGTAAGIMKGPMKVMSDVSSRAVAEMKLWPTQKWVLWPSPKQLPKTVTMMAQ